MSSVAMQRVLESVWKSEPSDNINFSAQTEQFLKKICDIYQVRHACYIAVDKRSLINRQPKVALTYPLEWQQEYRRSFSELHDPVLKYGTHSVLPFDWQNGKVRDMDTYRILETAKEFGVGEQGISFPILDQNDGKGIFSLTGDYSARDWIDLTNEYNRDFKSLAHFVHNTMRGVDQLGQPKLTGREKEVLKLCAFGLTMNEIAIKLDITQRTVNYYLNQARFKLNALNTTHAVFKATSRGIIFES